MSQEMLKEIIKAYDPHKITADEISGLTEMLKHESFKDLHEDIIKKIEEIEAVVKTRKKARKKIHIQKGAATMGTKRKTSMPMIDETNKDIDKVMPILWFTYLVDKEFSKNFEQKKPKDKKPDPPSKET